MNQMTVTISTLGCKVNHNESEKIISDLRSFGFLVANTNESADICIINSCTVTSVADAKTRQCIRKLRSRNPEAFICVIGCMPEVSYESVTQMKEVDMIVGNKNKEDVARLIAQRFPVQIPNDPITEKTSSRSRAFLKVEDGCDKYCAYCIIPFARGPVKSKPVDIIITEVSDYLARGYREIVLSGINLALYGKDLIASGDAASSTLYDLLKQLTNLKCEHDYRIRLGSLEPTVLKAKEAYAIAALPRICPHFHLSLQSGSNKTLESMGRNYTTQDYIETIRSLREIDPYFAITTDVIVGFPGETDDDFNESLDFVKKSGFSKTHVFPYSKRDGTRAAVMDDQVPDNIKKTRVAMMIESGNNAARHFHDGCIGQLRSTLIFGKDKRGSIRGLTDNGIDIRFQYKDNDAFSENNMIDLMVTQDNIFGLE